jgi:hypothetical protein
MIQHGAERYYKDDALFSDLIMRIIFHVELGRGGC